MRARLERLSNRFAHVLVANAQEVCDDVEAHEGVAHSRLAVIHNGVDLSDVPADVARQPPTALIIASLIRYKGHADVVRALSRLKRPPTVRVVGEGPERAVLEQEIRRRGLQGTVLLEGYQPAAARLWAEVQFGILASHEEGLPNAILEAMAAGLPVVATRVGGVAELVEDGVTGLLVRPEDPDSLAVAIARMAADPDLRRRCGARGRERAKSFGWPECADAHEALYQRLAARG